MRNPLPHHGEQLIVAHLALLRGRLHSTHDHPHLPLLQDRFVFHGHGIEAVSQSCSVLTWDLFVCSFISHIPLHSGVFFFFCAPHILACFLSLSYFFPCLVYILAFHRGVCCRRGALHGPAHTHTHSRQRGHPHAPDGDQDAG